MSFPSAGRYGAEAVLSSSGALVVSTPVTVYDTGTTTAASLYTDQTMATAGVNPVTTDSLGNLTFYAAPGIYDLAFTVGGVATTVTVECHPWYGDLDVSTLDSYIATQIANSYACMKITAAAGTCGSGGWSQLDLGTTQWATGGFSLGGSYDAVIPKSGKYRVSAVIEWNGILTADALSGISIWQNGANMIGGAGDLGSTGQAVQDGVTTQLECNAGDTITALIFQNTGATRSFYGGELCLEYVGP